MRDHLDALTARQTAIVTAIARAPYPPSLAQLCREVGLSSTSSVKWQLTKLLAAGLVQQGAAKAPRTLHLAPGIVIGPHGQPARLVPLSRCSLCNQTLPEDHPCQEGNPTA